MKKSIAIVAHDNKKPEILKWIKAHLHIIKKLNIIATGTTGTLIQNEFKLKVKKLNSGPLGGDQQIGALITEGKVDMLVFFWDPLEPQPHDPDVKALLRVAAVWDIPVACNRSTADALMASRKMFK
ncbi:methylglyoxal synthase [bacterium]|nr:methylglyoxal synthase [bacterium]